MSSDFQAKCANVAVVAGEGCALLLLAPMEYRTGLYIGVPPQIAWTPTGLIYAVVVMAIATGRALPAALGLVWMSGVIGALHAATEQAKHEHAVAVARALREGAQAPLDAASLDPVRAGTSIAVVTVAVFAMALLWRLSRLWHESRAAEKERAAAEEEARRNADRVARERAAEAVARRRREDAEAETLRVQAAAQREAEVVAQRAAAEEAAKAAEHARQMEALRVQAEAQSTQRAPRRKPAEQAQMPVRTRQQASRRAPQRRPAESPQTEADLQRRAAAKDAAITALREGREVDAGELAVQYYGTAEPSEKQRNAARANLSTWRRQVEQQGPQIDRADEVEEAAQ